MAYCLLAFPWKTSLLGPGEWEVSVWDCWRQEAADLWISGYLTSQAWTNYGKISLHKEKTTEDVLSRAAEGIEAQVSTSFFIQRVFLWRQGIDYSSLSSSVKKWLLSQSCEPMPKIPVPFSAQNGYKVGFDTHHGYCDSSQTTTLLCFTELEFTLCCFLMLNCIIEQSAVNRPSVFRFASKPTNTGEAADVSCLFITWISSVSLFAFSFFFFCRIHPSFWF